MMILPRIKGKYQLIKEKYGTKIISYVDITGLCLMVLFVLMLWREASWKLIFGAIGLYFIYQEVMNDLKILFGNFRR